MAINRTIEEIIIGIIGIFVIATIGTTLANQLDINFFINSSFLFLIIALMVFAIIIKFVDLIRDIF